MTEITAPASQPRPDNPLVSPRRVAAKEGTPHPALWVRSPQGAVRRKYQRRRSDVLGVLFPAVRHALGEDRYQELAREYLGVHRNDAAEVSLWAMGFPEYLRQASLPHRRFIVQLASLEYAIHAIAGKPQVGPHSASPQSRPTSARNFSDLTLSLPHKTQLLQFDFQVNDYLTEVERVMQEGVQEIVAAPDKPVTTRLAIYRRDEEAWRMPLSREQFDLLRILSRGRTLADVIRYADGDQDDQPSLWINQWLTEGLLVAA